MKRTGVCPKCEGRRVVHVAQVADAGNWNGMGIGSISARAGTHHVPRRVLVQRTVSKGVFGGTSEGFEPVGETEAYVCADCGFFEEYVREPHGVRWEDIVGASWYRAPDAGGPYR
jgi:hypothetical protein